MAADTRSDRGLAVPVRLKILLAYVLLFVVGLPGAGEAQVVSGRVTNPVTRESISAALVELLTPDSVEVDADLTDGDGRYSLEAGSTGEFRVRVRRLGYSEQLVDVVLQPGVRVLDIELATQPIQLEGLTASVYASCEPGPKTNSDTSRLWDLVVSVLDVARAAQSTAEYAFDMLLYTRTRTLDGRHLLTDLVSRTSESGAFVAVPLDLLEDQGYVDPQSDVQLAWYAPDPLVIVSDHFRDSHCFSVTDHADQGIVGLRFDPTPQRVRRKADERTDYYKLLFGEAVVEVAGTLWVDRRTGALRSMDFTYVGSEEARVGELAGGHATFEQLEGGLWIVRQWLVRTPSIRLQRGRIVPEQLSETGGYVVSAFQTDPSLGVEGNRTVLQPRSSGNIRGRLVAGDVPIALDGVEVRLSGSPRAVSTNSTGEFRFREVPPGAYVVTWGSPELGALGIPPQALDVSITEGEDTDVRLSGPSWQFVEEQLCGNTRADPGTGIVRVRGAGRAYLPGDPLPYFSEVVSVSSDNPLRAFSGSALASSGVATVCAVPTDIPLRVEVGDTVISVAPGRGRMTIIDAGGPGRD